jgi:hypothetical protein
MLSFSQASLFKAVAEGDRELLASLLAIGGDVNARNDDGQTPLILTIISGQDQLLTTLLERRADPFLKDQTGLNAFDWAERKGRMDVVRVLRRYAVRGVPDDPETTLRANASSELHSDRATLDEEKSRKYLAGLRQRFAENPHPKVANDQPQRAVETSAPAVNETTATNQSSDAGKLTSQVSPAVSSASTRKRCPQCNTIYDSDLLSYCAYHVVPLVDIDAPIVAVPEPKRPPILLWTLVLITLFVAAMATTYVSRRLFRNEQEPEETAASQPARFLRGDRGGQY